MSSLQRVVTALGHREPDRVPFFLLLTTHGAGELGLPIREYFSRPECVAEGQLRLQAKYRHDCLYSFFYAAVEVEAWGGDVLYFEDGPPNAGAPILRRAEDVLRIEAPGVGETPCLVKVLDAIRLMKAGAKDEIPIIGVVMSPFSVPVMQMGFERYLDLIFERPDLFDRLMAVNEEFCVSWANAQIEAGASAICYFDPVSSTTIIPREMFLKTGFPVACRTIARIKGPVATHLASGRCLPLIDDLARTGTVALGVSALEDPREMKGRCAGRVSLLGNLDGLKMRHWTPEEAEAVVKDAIAGAGPGGGFILSDNHGEIPWQVPESVLMAVSQAVHRWGHYPLDWAEAHGG